MAIKWVEQLPLQGKKVFCRVDFNVPLDDRQQVSDDTRIQAALPTLKYILEAGGKLICASHLGRPKGEPVDAFRMEPVGARLAELLPGFQAIVEPSLAVNRAVGGAILVISRLLPQVYRWS